MLTTPKSCGWLVSESQSDAGTITRASIGQCLRMNGVELSRQAWQAIVASEVPYVMVGGFAVIFYTFPRTTVDERPPRCEKHPLGASQPIGPF